MSPKKILSLGKIIDNAYEQYIKKGGKKNKRTRKADGGMVIEDMTKSVIV